MSAKRAAAACAVCAALGWAVAPPAERWAEPEPVPAGSPAAPQAVGSPAARVPARVPFGVGERLTYQVKFGVVRVGAAELRVVGIDTVGGSPAYRIRHTVQGRLPFYRVDDEQESWLDVFGLFSRKFRQNLREGDYRRDREYVFDIERRVWIRDDGETDTLPTAEPLDDIAFLYFARMLPLEVGRRYEFHRYFREERNPVVLEVLRRDTVLVPAGRFPVLVVRPIIKAGGVYGEGGESEVYLSDDERRIIVQTRAKAKVGALHLSLTEMRPGVPIGELPGFRSSGP